MHGDRQGSARRARWRLVVAAQVLAALALAACAASGSAPAAPPGRQPAAPAGPPAVAPNAPSAAPEAPAAAAPAPPEIDTLNVAVAAAGSTSLPLQVAIESGYFQRQGLTINLSIVAASVAVQGLVSGSIDIYQGGAAAIAGRLGGADIIYIGAAVDRSSLILFGEPGLTRFTDFRGKTVATTSAGAFGEIALHQTAKEFGMVPGQDFTLRYHPNPAAASATFTSGGAQGVIITPPQSTQLAEQGYPVIFDYYERGLKIIGPGMAVMRPFAQSHPNTLKAYLRAYLDGVKRAYDDREYALSVNRRYTNIDDPQLLAQDYDIGSRVWNKDLTVDPSAIVVVLQNSPLPNARDANPAEFYDNTYVNEVNATHGARLFPDVFAGR